MKTTSQVQNQDRRHGSWTRHLFSNCSGRKHRAAEIQHIQAKQTIELVSGDSIGWTKQLFNACSTNIVPNVEKQSAIISEKMTLMEKKPKAWERGVSKLTVADIVDDPDNIKASINTGYSPFFKKTDDIYHLTFQKKFNPVKRKPEFVTGDVTDWKKLISKAWAKTFKSIKKEKSATVLIIDN